MISEYAESLAGRLRFDPALSARVRQEVEDHLYQAVAEGGDEQQAIARFGDAHAIATQFAAASFASQLRKIGVAVLLVLAAVFLAMQTRLAWYDFTDWAVCVNSEALGALLATLDRSAFLLAAAAGVAAFAQAGAWRLFLCWIAVGLLAASVLCDGFLTAFRLAGWEWSADFVVPLASMAVEVACTAVLAARIRTVARVRMFLEA